MGPKAKGKGRGKDKKGKGPKEPAIDPKEVVTELEKEFFTFQLDDIEKKLSRIGQREEILKAEILDLENKIEDVKREQGAIANDLEKILREKEEEKCAKREEMLLMSDEIKLRVEQHKKRIQELEETHERTMAELAQKIEETDKDIKILEDYKLNKDLYHNKLEELDREMEELEIQHQRNLFEIYEKWEKAKMKVKKELQARLLQLSIEFRETNQVKIGRPCHRVTQENKAIHTAVSLLKEEIQDYQEKYQLSLRSMKDCRGTKNNKQDDKDKLIARTLVQIHVIKTLKAQEVELTEKLKEFRAVKNTNKLLSKKLHDLTAAVEKVSEEIDETTQQIEEKVQGTEQLVAAQNQLKKSWRRLKLLIRNSLKIAEEALAVRLIPVGGMEEEKNLTMEVKVNLFRKRRDKVFAKRGKTLQYLFDFLESAQPTEEEKKLLTGSTDSVKMETIDFGLIYERREAEKVSIEGLGLREAEEKPMGPVFYSSLTSLPRSISEIVMKAVSDISESEGGEFGEYGEGYKEEDDAIKGEEPTKVPVESMAENGEDNEEGNAEGGQKTEETGT